jgi:hypothetical protein
MDVSKLSEKLSNVAGKGTIAMFILIALIMIVIIVVYIVYRIKRSDLANVVIVKNSMRLFNMQETYKFDAHNLPPTLNGQEYTYSYWLYLVEYPPMDSNALLFCRGGSGQDALRSNPVISLDKGTNRLYVSVKTTMPLPDAPADEEGNSSLEAVLKTNRSGYLSSAIEYVPLQRWVHIVFTVQDNLLTLYMDGDIYTVANIFDMPRPGDKRPVFAGTAGDVFVGPLPNLPTQPRAFIGKMQFYNFALMHKDVRSLYAEGPMNQSMLGRMGLPEYGIRTPIYRMES